jgi:hypothetical protein
MHLVHSEFSEQICDVQQPSGELLVPWPLADTGHNRRRMAVTPLMSHRVGNGNCASIAKLVAREAKSM